MEPNGDPKVYKFGFDVHGVITAHPKEFAILTRILMEAGHQIHIITGQQNDEVLKAKLVKYNISYTHIFSITTYLLENNYTVTWDSKGEPHFAIDAWNYSKAVYCEENNIDMHFDDSDTYGAFFKTPYIGMAK